MRKMAHLKLMNIYLYKRMLNVQRIVLLLLYVTFTVPSLAEVATMQLPQLSLNLNNVTRREVFNTIEKNTKYVFIYSDELLTELNEKVSIHVNKQTLDKILDKVLHLTSLGYKITNRQITVSKKAQTVIPKTPLKITGHVTDEKGEALIGVNIQEEGTNNVVITDMDGNFSIYNVSGPSSVLQFTYIGFVPLKIVVGKQTNMSVKLDPDIKGLEEVVVVGYGSQKRESVIGAITTMKPAALQVNQSRSVTNALAGQVAGVIAVQRSGEPGNDTSDFWIRGISSFGAGTTPLVLVDGIERSLSNISPEEIESFSVLKDATATAVYGVRGANGVILVQTKRGQIGKPRIQIKADYGFSAPTMLPEFVDGAKYMEVMNVASQFSSGKDMYTQAAIDATRNGTDPDLYPNVNWLKTITKDHVPNGRVSLDINGGTERLRYSMVLAYHGETGMTVTDPGVEYNTSNNLSRYNIRTNLDMNLTPSTEINVSLGGYIMNQRTPGFSTNAAPFTDIIYLAFKNTPIVHPTVYSNGQIPANTSQTNPWAAATHSGFISSYKSSLQSVFAVTQDIGKLWHPLKGLKAKATFSFDTYAWNSFLRRKTQTTYMATGRDEEGNLLTSITNQGDDYLQYAKEAGGNRTMYLEGQLSYSRLLADNHQIDGLLLYNMRDYVNADAASAIYSLPYRTQGIAARLSYSYKGRYFIEGNFGYNGSENFSKGNKWGFFPSVSAAWVISEEKFMKRLPVIDNLKFRIGYGLAGNQSGIDSYTTLSLVKPNGVIPVGNSAAVSLGDLRNTNPDLKWEVKHTFNTGIDLAMFGNRLLLSANYYNSKTTDMLYLYNVSVPPFTYNTLLANIGSMRNSGLEIAIGITPLKTQDMELNINANITFQQNKLLSLSGMYNGELISAPEYKSLASLDGAGFHGGYNHIVYQVVGQPLGVFYLPRANGLVSDGNGGYTYDIADLNGGGVSLEDGEDRYVAGQAVPKTILGSNLSFRYKRFDISVQINGAFGHKIYNGTSLTYMNMNIFPDYNVMQEAPARNIKDQTATDYWLENGAYVNFDYVTLGWNVPIEKVQKLKKYVRSLRLAFTVNNLATISGYSGLSPMINSSTVNSTLGLDDKRGYPLARTYTLGLSINF